MTNRLERQWPDRETGRAELYLVLVGLCLCVGDVKYSSTVAHSAIPCKHFLFNMNTVRGSFTAKTLVRAKNDGLTPVALRAKRPLIAPSRPSVSRLGPLSSLLGAGKWGAGGRTTVRPALAPQLSCKRCVFAARRRSCVETLRAPSLPLVAPPLGFPRYRAKGAASAAPENGERKTEHPYGATDGVPEKATRRETEGGGRGQRRSRRATDGARSGSRLTLRLRGPHFPRTVLVRSRGYASSRDALAGGFRDEQVR